MSEVTKVAVITGANKGLGYHTTRLICKRFDGAVILTARDSRKGQIALSRLKAEGLKANFHQLDVSSPDSIARFKSHIKKNYGRIDVLVQNAAVVKPHELNTQLQQEVVETVQINFLGVLNLFHALFSFLHTGARIVNVASGMGKLEIVCNDLKKKFSDPELTEEELISLLQDFVLGCKTDTLGERGWPPTAYGVSKLGVIALTKIQAKQIEKANLSDVLVSAVSPGWVKTDMAGDIATLTADQAAAYVTDMAFLPKESPNGQFWKKGQIISWS